MNEELRLARIKEWNNRDIWNDPVTAKEQQDNKQYHFYGS